MNFRDVRLLAFVSLLAATQCLAQSTTPQYSLQDSEALRGSSIRRYVTSGSTISINRTFAELSPEEKASINTYYEKIEPGDEPPFPLAGLRPIHAAIAKIQQRFLVTGELVLIAAVDRTGNVTEVKIIGSSTKEMTQAAASVIALSKFKPALCEGQPCAMEFPFKFIFKVQPE